MGELIVYRELEQRSDEWYAARCGIVTASAVGKLITPSTVKPASNDDSRRLVTLLAAERITGTVEATYTSDDMWRGIEAEPFARGEYEKHHGCDVETVGFMVRDYGAYRIGYSPDGLVGDDGLIEIKAPRSKEHVRTIVADAVPAHYMAQLQAGLLVTGRSWIDYVSYCAGMPLWVRRVLPDERWQAALVAAVEQAEKSIAETVDAYLRAVEGLPVTEVINLEVVI